MEEQELLPFGTLLYSWHQATRFIVFRKFFRGYHPFRIAQLQSHTWIFANHGALPKTSGAQQEGNEDMRQDRRLAEVFVQEPAAPNQLSRREVLKRGSVLGVGASAMAMRGSNASAGAILLQEAPEGEQGTYGGTLNVALIGEPPTLDIHQTTTTIVGLITWNIYEPLFTFNHDFESIPMLAESHEVSADGLTQTVRLRQGVPFHNGEEMRAADVIASVQRWGALSGMGESLLAIAEDIVAVDDYTVEFRMSQPFGAFLPTISHNFQGLAIYPKSVIDAAGEGQLTEFIGTGPYRFVEQQADRFIRLERFEEYAALPGEPDGYGGHKYQYLDEIVFNPVPDEAARVAGLRAGDYDYLESISPDQSLALEGDPNVSIEILAPNGWETFVLNWRSPLMENLQIRQAVQAALNHEPILEASQGEGFYRLDPGVMLQETAWHTLAGQELYNRNDPETARQLLEEAGYDGTPIRFMTTQEYRDQYNAAVVGRQQLEEVGFVIDLQVYDWATLTDRRNDPEAWDIFTTGISFKPDPTMVSMMQLCSWPGWWCSDPSMVLLEQLRTESDAEVRYDIWEQLQQLFYEEIPHIKLGDSQPVSARSTQVQGLVRQTQLGAILWNVWFEE